MNSYLQHLAIENFQSWVDGTFEFVPGLNVITGASNRGKSAIIRAVIWLLRNKPQGLGFANEDADLKKELVRVAAEFSDGEWIARERNENVDLYETPSLELKAMRGKVPDEIAEISRISDSSIQGQHDIYFLLQSSPGEVAARLNEISGLEVIDYLTSELRKLVGRTEDGVRTTDLEIEKISEELDALSYIDDLKIDIDRLEGLLKERDIKRDERLALIDIKGRIDRASDDIKTYDGWLEVEKEAAGLLNEAKEIELLIIEHQGILSVVNRITDINREMKLLDEEVDDYNFVIKLDEQCRELWHERKGMREADNLASNIAGLEVAIDALDIRIATLDEEIAEMGICPTCGRPLCDC